MQEKLKIAVFIDFDNIEIGVKSTLQREFDVAAVLDALKERGEIVTKVAYANWGRMETSTKRMAEHAVQMVQRDPSPRGDKNGADINLSLDALEMAFTHDHINAFAIVSGDSDFIALVNKLKQYNKVVFVVGGRAFTSTILQKNCHEFVSYESLLDDGPKRSPQGGSGGSQGDRGPRPPRRQPLELAQAMPLVDRALQALERREVRPQLGLLKSTMLQLDSSFSEKAYGAGSFSDFVEKLNKANLITVTGGEGRYLIARKGLSEPDKKTVHPEEALPALREVLETHRLEVDGGIPSDTLQEWVKGEFPDFDWARFGFQEFGELLNYAQDQLVVRLEPTEESGVIVFLGAEFHPPAEPEREPEPLSDEEDDGPQPVVPGQPTAVEVNDPPPPKAPVKRTARKRTPKVVDGNTVKPPRPRRPRKKPDA
ncbi:MAG: NYN domain-containing protein [Bryobacterales bacterium]|nr:NYN domain-containing protein [Bryobacterales bacterium]